MAVATGIFNHAATAGQALTGTVAAPMSSSTTGTSSTSDTSSSEAAITANDFLTLLVTELQNQDPTADTDPNEYINQLVEVNSLEQLIDSNGTLTTDLGGATPSSGTGSAAQVAGTPPGLTGASPATATPSASSHVAGTPAATRSNAATGSPATTQTHAAQHTPGNLSVPGVNPAARRVAHALAGRTHTQPASGGTIAAQ
jgi:flagellar basal-body rod modification protein FlgD